MTVDASPESPRRRAKGDKRARTRARLIQVAAQLSEEKGYDGVTMQEVARRAGMSNGAIYGNFKNRDDLLAAIGPTYWPQVQVNVAPGASVADVLQALAAGLIAIMPARTRVGAGRLKGLAYTLANPALMARTREIAARRYDLAAEWWRAAFPDPGQLPMPADQWVRVVNVMIEGLTLQRLLVPDLITDEVIYAAFAALGGASEPPEPR